MTNIEYIRTRRFRATQTINTMAKTKGGKKKVHVKPHTRKGNDGKTKKVPEHYRSTPN